jgi:hypothetical protein
MSSTSRFLLDPAPAGLALVQDLVNTRPASPYGLRDLLGTVADAQRFTGEVVRAWKQHSGAAGSPGRITSADVVGLRRLRRDVERALHGEGDLDVRTAARLEVRSGGVVGVQPTGRGARWVAGAVWAEVLLAQHDGQWTRLKICRNPVCPCAFYDRSRNNSRVWHDVRTCGNVANLRASRARRRAAAG